jgi:predicted ester cyclase
LLAESRISIHTWPEKKYAAIDLFMCGTADPGRAVPVLQDAFRPRDIIVVERLRGVAEPGMSAEDQMRFLYESVWLGDVWSSGNVGAADMVLARDFRDHRPIPQFVGDRDGRKLMAADWHRAFPDMAFRAEDIISGRRLVGRYTASGHHLGTFAGIPATGKLASLTGIDIFRFRSGLVTDWWHNEDLRG